MKQSIFRQTLTSVGKVRQVNGEIVVTMNYTTKTIAGTHAGTHDDFTKQVPVHKIEAFVDGILWSEKKGLDSEAMVEIETEKMIISLENHINDLSNTPPVKTFVEKMRALGFK